MLVDAGKLFRALKAKYGHPARVLARLGLDADLVAPSVVGGNGAAALRAAVEDLFDGFDLDDRLVERILKALNKGRNFERSNGLRGGENADDEQLERLREFLIEKGVGEDEIAETIQIAKNGSAGDNLSDPSTQLGFGGRWAMDGRSPLEQIRGENTDWATAIRRDDLGTLGLALEQGTKQRLASKRKRASE
jgi:hypothetical protein